VKSSGKEFISMNSIKLFRKLSNRSGIIRLNVILSFLLFISVELQPKGQTVLFDFDNAPLSTSLPIYQTAGGVTARLSATGQGFSIQNANVLGFTPPGFAGRIIYPNSVFLADLLVHFDHAITGFSIMYACQELGCDDAATMRVTAFLNGIYIGTNTKTATFPGTWPVDTLQCSFANGFDSVVVHYDHRPPTCQDYGTIFVADNMRILPSPVSVVSNNNIPSGYSLEQNFPNPFNPMTSIKYHLASSGDVVFCIRDLLGNEILYLNQFRKAGTYEVLIDGLNLASGMYFYSVEVNGFKETKKMVLLK